METKKPRMRTIKSGSVSIMLIQSDKTFQIRHRQKNTWPGANPEVELPLGPALSLEEIKALHEGLGQVIQWANTNWNT